MQTIDLIVRSLSNLIWGIPMQILLVGTGLFLTFYLKGLQFSKLFYAIKILFGKESQSKGDISQFSALMLSLGATVGIGSIVGVATAISVAGPGAVFWMWATGLVGMATKYAESILAVKYREEGSLGYKGGPMYYIKNGLKMPKLAMAFAIFTIIASIGTGNMTQSNAVSSILSEQISLPTWVSGLLLTLLTAIIVVGGIKSIGKFTSYFAPVMVLLYVVAVGYIISTNFDLALHAIQLIFEQAFNPKPVVGGATGALIATMIKTGIARGLYSNEAGLGSSAIIAASAQTHHPVRQALVSMLQTFIVTLIVCTATATIILMAPEWHTLLPNGERLSANLLTLKSTEYFLGSVGAFIIFATMIFFAYSTIIGWAYYGEKCTEYAFGASKIKYYRLLFLVCIMVGALAKIDFVWNLADLANGLMAIPNLIALILLHKVVYSETRWYFSKQNLNQ
ncbi:alanine/glycine:cation symporter family protein [Helicobacter cetorum]|uniref:D-alanine glycine permease n=1 Tax=Helicobacter cetorum (strain ATCC BAA-429 / MIT 00-7128) TaxID=182217 RepID=I0EP85_HELC0|nr:sodium:alanine symporter family protein [Helicobacter cetorum]AFI04754.1 D-alanine glycine permease [Helicobacter cetorum MIT 00-7128]